MLDNGESLLEIIELASAACMKHHSGAIFTGSLASRGAQSSVAKLRNVFIPLLLITTITVFISH